MRGFSLDFLFVSQHILEKVGQEANKRSSEKDPFYLQSKLRKKSIEDKSRLHLNPIPGIKITPEDIPIQNEGAKNGQSRV